MAAGLLGLASFMVFGFVLIYLRDFAPGAQEWVDGYSSGAHSETRLSHVHGALFSVLNVVIALVVSRLRVFESSRAWIAGLSLAGLLMPLGILAEVIFGAPPVLVLVGAMSILISFSWAGVAALKAPSA